MKEKSRKQTGLWALAVSALALCAALLAGCAAGPLTGGYTITDGSVEVSGSSLVVTLECDPSTGYEWSQSFEGDGLEFDGVDRQSNAEDPDGDPDTVGFDTFNYTGTGAGTQTITLTCAAPDSPADEVKTVTIESKTNNSGEFTAVRTTASDGSTGEIK